MCEFTNEALRQGWTGNAKNSINTLYLVEPEVDRSLKIQFLRLIVLSN